MVVLLQLSIEQMSTVYTCNTYFLMCWLLLFIHDCPVNILMQ